MTMSFRLVVFTVSGTKIGVFSFAKMQLRKMSCSSISGNGPPWAVSSMSQPVTDASIALQKSFAPLPTRPLAPIIIMRGLGFLRPLIT